MTLLLEASKHTYILGHFYSFLARLMITAININLPIEVCQNMYLGVSECHFFFFLF